MSETRHIWAVTVAVLFTSINAFAGPANMVEIDGNAVGYEGADSEGEVNSNESIGENSAFGPHSGIGIPGDDQAANRNSSNEPDLTGVPAGELDPTNPDHILYLGDAGGASYVEHHNDTDGSKWLYLTHLEKKAPVFVGDIFEGVHFFYRDEVLKHIRPEEKGLFQVRGKVEVGCKGRWDNLDGGQRFKLLANNEGSGEKRTYSYHACHIHKCKKVRPVCFGVFVTITAGKEIVNEENHLMTPLPPGYEIECHGSTYWKKKSSCRISYENGSGWDAPSSSEQMLGKKTLNNRTPATLAPGVERETTYRRSGHLRYE